MPILGIHPADKDLNFLKRVNRNISDAFPELYTYIRLEANHHTHEACIERLNSTKNCTVIFYCHALDRSIRGCKIEHRSITSSHRNFNYGSLISPSKNLSVFEENKVFCLSCFSRDLGEHAVKAGAKVFLGFGDIPFYIRESYKENAIESAVKRELSTIVERNLIKSIKDNRTFNEISIHLQLAFDKRRKALLNDKSSGKTIRIEVSNVLSRIKNGITMFGDGNLRINN